LVHFHLELGDFEDCNIEYPNAELLKPPYKFVIEGKILQTVIQKWDEKVVALVDFDKTFEHSLFFNIKLISYNWEMPSEIWAEFDKEEESSFFSLLENRSYILDLSLLISENNFQELEKYECKLEYEKKDILISNPNIINIGTEKDNRRYKLITKSIDSTESFDYVKFLSLKKITMIVKLNFMKL
jgi:hypothetical protein